MQAKIIETKTIRNKEKIQTLAKVENWEQKLAIMRNKGKLKNVHDKVYIDDDLTAAERNVQKKIRERGRQEKANNKRIKKAYQKIKIDDKWYKWEEESSMLVQVKDGEPKNENQQ